MYLQKIRRRCKKSKYNKMRFVPLFFQREKQEDLIGLLIQSKEKRGGNNGTERKQ